MGGGRGAMRSSLACVGVGGLLAAVALGAGTASAQRDSGNRPASRGSEQRVALVIGNASYAVGRLNNPVLDARAITQTLRGFGFEVLAHENLIPRTEPQGSGFGSVARPAQIGRAHV